MRNRFRARCTGALGTRRNFRNKWKLRHLEHSEGAMEGGGVEVGVLETEQRLGVRRQRTPRGEVSSFLLVSQPIAAKDRRGSVLGLVVRARLVDEALRSSLRIYRGCLIDVPLRFPSSLSVHDGRRSVHRYNNTLMFKRPCSNVNARRRPISKARRKAR
ncbi:hypothetical protein BD626DRAFT_509890 [Schizophyllum amplum]|uniref:Uncharacterized protein n=1 Tax=Schizophyllum amplum TaxID=97359 RepID=A0A550C241_9AGAR|nr:hypothetical protein BD626DRAFT_509890 [Auriculariopsis ampla]